MRNPARPDRRTRSAFLVMTTIWIVAIAGACGSAASAPGARGAAAAGAPDQPAASAGGVSSGAGGGGYQDGTGQQAPLVDDTKIVRTGSIELTVADTDKALLAGRDAVRGFGGYIGASQQQRSDDKIVATVTYRIPVARWEDALDAIRHLGTAVGEKTDAIEVTGQLVDLDARIRNLKASETALVGYAANAPKVSDLLEIEARLTDTRGEIERLTAQQANLSDQAAMATLTVTYGTELVAVTEVGAKWDPAAEVDRASASLLGVGQAIASFLIVFAIVWLPIILGLAVLALVGLAVARRLGGRHLSGFPRIGPRGPDVPPAPAPEA